MNKRLFRYLFSVSIIFSAVGLSAFYNSPKKTGRLIIHFVNMADNKKVVKDSIYSNAFGETYSISKLKYYVSNVQLNNFKEKESYHLIDAFAEDSIVLNIPAGSYTNFIFLLGVDSLKNCSGAQSGALDPLNDMFWTWNSGYVMFKMEGHSSASNVDQQRIEQHIGGYKGPYKTMRAINLPLGNTITVSPNENTSLTILVDIDKYWKGINEIKIADSPVLMTISEKSKNAADNFAGMFSIATSPQSSPKER
ncbi:MAG: MbnP family protein [Ferruginibacter sp.]